MVFFNDKISIRQLQILLILDIFGTGVIVLPRMVCEYAGEDGYIAIVLATVVAIFYGLLLTSAGRLFPGDDFVTYSSKILSPFVGVVLSVGFVIKLIINAAMELRFFGEIIRQTLLNNTPFWVVCFCMIAISAYAASKGYETRARLGEFLIFLVFIPILFVFSIALFSMDVTNIMPVLASRPEGLLKGAFFAGRAFTGIELCLLVFPYINKPDKVRKGVIGTIAFIGAFMVFITIITIGIFGASDIKWQMWPVLEMMDVVEIPGSFIERQQALIMSFWIISVFFIVNAGLFFSSLLLKDVFKKGTHTAFIIACGLIIFAVALFPSDINQAYRIMEFMFITFGIGYMAVVPALLLLVAKIRGLGARGEGNEK